NAIPGLVYRASESQADFPCLLNTGVQRLVKDLDSLPMPLAGLTHIEPAHRRRTLSPRPFTPQQVRKKAFLATLVTTHGCRFHCDFCPIPAYQQRTWRYKSPERIVDEIRQLGEELNYRYFFGTDDNFFNDRGSVEEILTGMAKGTVHGRSFSEAIHFLTEATEFDVYKNRDLLPLARKAGLKTIYFGIEDLNAQLINKGQTLNKTEELFRELHRHEMEGYAMMIHHDDQPLFSREPKHLGVVNQAHSLYKMGAVGYHTTYIAPSHGAKNFETMFNAGSVISRISGRPIPEAFYDGNHVIASRFKQIWMRQLQLWAAYLAFYNPLHFAQSLLRDQKKVHNRRLFRWQVMGGAMIPISILKGIPYLLATAFCKIERHAGPTIRCLPMYDVHSGERVRWGIDSDSKFAAPDRLDALDVNPAAKTDSRAAVRLPVIS
ncbi:MAG: radical SAM protein, partial [Planctomycetaceae bacterium]